MKYSLLVATVTFIALQLWFFTTRDIEPAILVMLGFATSQLLILTGLYWVFDRG